MHDCWILLTILTVALVGCNSSDGGGGSQGVLSCDVAQDGLHYCEEYHGTTSSETGCPVDAGGVTPGNGCSRDGVAGTCSQAAGVIYFYGSAPVTSAVKSVCPGGSFTAGDGKADGTAGSGASSSDPARVGFFTCDGDSPIAAPTSHICLETAYPGGKSSLDASTRQTLSNACGSENANQHGFGFSTTVGCSTALAGCVCHNPPGAEFAGTPETYQYNYDTDSNENVVTAQVSAWASYCTSHRGDSFICFGGLSAP